MTAGVTPSALVTAHGRIHFPAYVPVTTFGPKYPLDALVRPYLVRLASAAMVSFHYARDIPEHPGLPLLVDSGGFRSLFAGASVTERGGLGVLETTEEGAVVSIHPSDVLDLQERVADVAFTLDFPVPPSMDEAEGRRRQALSISNARWALANRRRRDLPLYASLQGSNPESYAAAARELSSLDFDGFAIGGLVPRASDSELVRSIVDAVRAAVPGRPIHVFGIGKPDMVRELFARGVQSVDSSSYVKLAADGRLWSDPSFRLTDASPVERLHLALANLATAAQSTLPLSAAGLVFRTPSLSTGRDSGNSR